MNTLTAKEGIKMWTNKAHLLELAKFVPLKDVPHLRVCHQVAKEDPGVIVGRSYVIPSIGNRDTPDATDNTQKK